jgi:predicted DNA-binding transcriptional regulator YafY
MSVLERIYYFHDELLRSRYPNSRTLMREFEISLPTAKRDIAYLRDRLLAPLEFDSARNGFYYSDDSFNLPFANTPRIVFLLGILNRLAEETGLSGLSEIEQLEDKLLSMIPRGNSLLTDTIQCEWIEVEHPDPAVFDVIIEAIVRKFQLKITYQSLQLQQTARVIEPLRLINYQGRWYLLCWCTLRRDYRIFHLARILQVQLGEKNNTADRTLPEELNRSFGIFKGSPLYDAEIRFTGYAAQLIKNQFWHKDQKIEENDNGILLKLPVRDDREIMMKILQYGSQAEVLKPLQLREKIAEEIKKMYSKIR